MSLAGGLVSLIAAAEFGEPTDVLAADDYLRSIDDANEPLSLRCNSLRYRAYALRMAGFRDRAQEVGELSFETSLHLGQTEIALNAAEMLAFMALDLEDQDRAEFWIGKSRELGVGIVQPMRDKGVTHASRRALIQGGNPRAALEQMMAELDALRRDPVESRRAGELATAAWAAALVGEVEVASTLVLDVVPLLAQKEPEFLLDYPVEVTAKALLALGRHAEAKAALTEYASKQPKGRLKRLPPFFALLLSAEVAMLS